MEPLSNTHAAFFSDHNLQSYVKKKLKLFTNTKFHSLWIKKPMTSLFIFQSVKPITDINVRNSVLCLSLRIQCIIRGLSGKFSISSHLWKLKYDLSPYIQNGAHWDQDNFFHLWLFLRQTKTSPRLNSKR